MQQERIDLIDGTANRFVNDSVFSTTVFQTIDSIQYYAAQCAFDANTLLVLENTLAKELEKVTEFSIKKNDV
ncbi:MAG: hypothetical protein LRY27_00925 [Chitinophagales bacterium]|nr:hypothetical protein [Chitinophagales bacterium]